jgi:rare lipoprotein A
MPQTRFGRREAALGLLIATGLSAVIGCQSMLATPAATVVETTPVVQAPAFQRLTSAPPMMAAAVPTGQFEESFAPAPRIVPPPAPDPISAVSNKPAPVVYELGIASTYGEGDGFEGNRTACGQIFHTSVVQIAHKSLPCGTIVRVEDVDSGKSVVAEVTDRGPYVKGRVVDLSWGAFKQLHPQGPDLLQVAVYVVDGAQD